MSLGPRGFLNRKHKNKHGQNINFIQLKAKNTSLKVTLLNIQMLCSKILVL